MDRYIKLENALRTLCADCFWNGRCKEPCRDYKRLAAIKAEDPRQKGEWIGGELGKCSACGHEGCSSDIWNGCKENCYCPNCGALLWEEGKEEDEKQKSD